MRLGHGHIGPKRLMILAELNTNILHTQNVLLTLHTHIYTYIHMHTLTRMYTHAHTHTYTHTCTRAHIYAQGP